MAIEHTGLVLAVDASAPAELAGFWQGILGGDMGEVDAEGDVDLISDRIKLVFIQVPGAKVAKNRLHLDLRATDFDAAVQHALDLGATKANDVYDGESWQVLRDPESNEFCILRPASTDG